MIVNTVISWMPAKHQASSLSYGKNESRLSVLREAPRPFGKAGFRHQGWTDWDGSWIKGRFENPHCQGPGWRRALCDLSSTTSHHRLELPNCSQLTQVINRSPLGERQRQTLALAVAPQAAKRRKSWAKVCVWVPQTWLSCSLPWCYEALWSPELWAWCDFCTALL